MMNRHDQLIGGEDDKTPNRISCLFDGRRWWGTRRWERDQLSDGTTADNNGNSIMQRLAPEFGENREMIQLSHVI